MPHAGTRYNVIAVYITVTVAVSFCFFSFSTYNLSAKETVQHLTCCLMWLWVHIASCLGGMYVWGLLDGAIRGFTSDHAGDISIVHWFYRTACSILGVSDEIWTTFRDNTCLVQTDEQCMNMLFVCEQPPAQ
jgi:hypothetical protein